MTETATDGNGHVHGHVHVHERPKCIRVSPLPRAPDAPLFAGAALLDAERLDVYRIALEFQAIAGQLAPKRGHAELRDQLDRASISIVLNIAEGNVSQRE